MNKIKVPILATTALKLFIIIALIVSAATKQQYSYYNFLRWIMMTAFIYLFYKSYNQRQFGLLIYFGTVAILFNPFHKIWFQKQAWHVIDYFIASITALTIIYDWLYLLKIGKQSPKT